METLNDEYGKLIRQYFLGKHQPEWMEEHLKETLTTKELIEVIKEQFPDEIEGIVKALTGTLTRYDSGDEVRAEHKLERESFMDMHLAVDLAPGIPEGFSFAGFKETGSTGLAKIAAAEWINPGYGKPILVLAGPPGVGKTHLATAAAAALQGDGKEIVYRTDSQIMADLRRSYSDNNTEAVVSAYSSVMNLVWDDLGLEATGDALNAARDQIIDIRYQNAGGVRTMICTNQKSEDLPARLASRLGDKKVSTVVTIDAPDYRQRER